MNAEHKLNTNSVAWFIFCSFCAYAYVDVTAVWTCTKHAQALRKLHCCLWNPPLTGLICTKLFISCVERCEPLENTLGQVKKITITTTKQTKKCFSFPPAKFLEVTSLFLLICCWNWELERTKTNTVCHESGYKRKEKNTSAFRQGKHLLILSSIDDFNAPYLLKYSQSSLNVDTDTLGATKTVSVLSG